MGRKRRSREFKKNSDIIDIEEARKKRQAKKEKMKADAEQKEAERQSKTPSARRKAKQNKIRLIYTVIAIAVIAAIGVSLYNIISLKAEERAILQEQKELEEEKEKLSQELDNLNDPEYMEQKAREQLRLVMPGESIYIFPDLKENQDSEQENTDE